MKNTVLTIVHKVKKIFSPQCPAFWMVVACAVWLILFRDFFTGRIALSSDAISYFDHTHYYLESLKRGVFPLWDYLWQGGSPNEFFLRRIGGYNPIYLWMLFLDVLGMPPVTGYLLIQSLYFFLGCAGFYLLTKAVYRDDRVAFTAFLFLLFSAVGTRIFDSYMCLVIVPTIWFFYFAFTLLSAPSRRALAGLALSFMIAMNTYIPLFFLTIVIAILIFWILFFPREAWEAAKRIVHFITRDGIFFWMIFAAVVIALVPPMAFFMNKSAGSVALPDRHGASAINHFLSVDPSALSWGVMGDLFYTSFYSDFRRFILALVYVPFLALFVWALGGFCRANRRIWFYVSVGIFFILLGTSYAAPIYAFLYKYVFYFKYMRNLHFFLWFILLPLFIFMAAEFLSQLFKAPLSKGKNKLWAAALVVIVSAGFCVWAAWQGDAVPTTFFSIGASLGLCLWYVFAREHARGWALWLAFLVVITPQWYQVFTYAIHNMPNRPGYEYFNLPGKFAFTTSEDPGSVGPLKRCEQMYYCTAKYQKLCQGVSSRAFSALQTHKLVAFGRIEDFDNSYPALQEVALGNRDVAFADGWGGRTDLSPGASPQRFSAESPLMKVRLFNANRLQLKTDFPKEKFLVYFDNYSEGWKAFLDGRETKLFLANGSFKGVRVPAGPHVVEFRYGNSVWYAFQWALIVLFNALFYGLVWAFWKRWRAA